MSKANNTSGKTSKSEPIVSEPGVSNVGRFIVSKTSNISNNVDSSNINRRPKKLSESESDVSNIGRFTVSKSNSNSDTLSSNKNHKTSRDSAPDNSIAGVDRFNTSKVNSASEDINHSHITANETGTKQVGKAFNEDPIAKVGRFTVSSTSVDAKSNKQHAATVGRFTVQATSDSMKANTSIGSKDVSDSKTTETTVGRFKIVNDVRTQVKEPEVDGIKTSCYGPFYYRRGEGIKYVTIRLKKK